MGPISLEIVIDAPREEVFDRIADLSRRGSWTDHFISDIHLQRTDGAGVGASIRFRVGAPAVRFAETMIDEVDRPGRISERGRGGRWDRVAVRTAWELRGGEGSPTDLTLTFWTEPGNPLDHVKELRAGGWWKRRWRKALERLRDEIESRGERAVPVGVGGEDRTPDGLP